VKIQPQWVVTPGKQTNKLAFAAEKRETYLEIAENPQDEGYP
jgi:hypothetical protein